MIRLVVLLTLLFSFPSQAKVVDYIAAVVNGKPVLYSEVVEYAKENGIPDLKVARDRLIEREILLTEAESKGIKVSDKEVERALKDLMKRLGFKEKSEFEKALKKEGMSLSDVKEKLREQLMVAKLIDREVKSKVEVTGIDVEKYCRKVESKPLRDVFFIYTKSQEKAEKAMTLLSQGIPFEKVARELSEDRGTASNGGYLGKVTKGSLIEPLDRAVWGMKPGSYKLIKTDNGYYIVYVKSEEKGVCDRNKIKQKLYMEKFQKALKDYIDKLRRSASVKVYM